MVRVQVARAASQGASRCGLRLTCGMCHNDCILQVTLQRMYEDPYSRVACATCHMQHNGCLDALPHHCDPDRGPPTRPFACWLTSGLATRNLDKGMRRAPEHCPTNALAFSRRWRSALLYLSSHSSTCVMPALLYLSSGAKPQQHKPLKDGHDKGKRRPTLTESTCLCYHGNGASH